MVDNPFHKRNRLKGWPSWLVVLSLLAIFVVWLVVRMGPQQSSVKATRVADEPGNTRRIQLAGKVVEFVPQSQVNIYTPVGAQPALSLNVRDLLKGLPIATLRHAWLLEFEGNTGDRTLSVSFGSDVFKGDGDFVVRIEKPIVEVTVRPRRDKFRPLRIETHAPIQEKVWYEDLPHLSEKENRLTCAKAPQIEVRLADESRRVIADAPMEKAEMCWGGGWYLDLRPSPAEGQTLSITVSHDTGDLWGKISTTKEFVVE
jgi:hypothetical protein